MAERPTQTTSSAWIAAARLVTLALASGGAIMATAVFAASAAEVSLGTYTRDIASLGADAGVTLPPFAGAVSLLNIMLWACIGSSAVLVAKLVPAKRTWLVSFAGFVLLLAADDAMLIHENTGISEVAFFLVYGLGALVLTGAVVAPRPPAVPGSPAGSVSPVRALLLAAGPMGFAFILGGILFAGSIVFDHVAEGPLLLEDGLKLLGALVWMTVPVLGLPGEAARRIESASRECTCRATPASEVIPAASS